jgi:PD-(D/E)XK endonuclease
MERLINRRQQGDLGEASAIEWFTRQGATVFAPLGHSPDIDLIADFGMRTLCVQIKTSVCRARTPNGHPRFAIQLATLGGNQSWSGRVKKFDDARVDALFVLTGDGRRWLIPAAELEGATSVMLGGVKYSEFEIEPSSSIDELVYGARAPSLESLEARGSFGDGEPSEPVKFVAKPEWVRIPPPPLSSPPQDASAQLDPERPLPEVPQGVAPRGQTRVSGNRQIVIPKRAFDEAGLERGDRLKAFAGGPGEIVFRRVAREQKADGPPGGGPSRLSREGL